MLHKVTAKAPKPPTWRLIHVIPRVYANKTQMDKINRPKANLTNTGKFIKITTTKRFHASVHKYEPSETKYHAIEVTYY